MLSPYRFIPATLLSIVALFAFAPLAHAESVQWNNVFTVKLKAEITTDILKGTTNPDILVNPNVSITYNARVVNDATGDPIACGSSVAQGTKVRYEFVPHVSEDIYWFATGNEFDSPYGDWGVSTVAPPVSCLDKDFYYQYFASYAGTPSVSNGCNNCWYKAYAPFIVDPPTESISAPQGATCGTADANGNVACTLDTLGSVSATFNFGATQGRFYLRTMQDQSVKYAYGCMNHGRLLDYSQKRHPQFVAPVPVQIISCPITVTDAPTPNTTPTAPTVTTGGACTVGTAFTLSFTSSDPAGHQIKYGVDWDADGSVDQWVPPGGYVNSGTQQSASRTYSTAGTKTVKVIAQNDQGALSSWSMQTFSCTAQNSCPVGYVWDGTQCTFSACPSGYVQQGNQCVLPNQCGTPPVCQGNNLVNSCTGALIQTCSLGCASGSCIAAPTLSATLNATPSLLHVGDTTTVSWSAQNASSCSVHGTNGDSWTGISSSKTSSPIQGQTVYTLHCIGVANSNPPTIDKNAIVNIIPTFQEQ